MHESFEMVHSYLMAALFDPIMNQLVRDIEEVGFSNRKGILIFRYKGGMYNSHLLTNFMATPELDPRLHPQMELLYIEKKEVDIEKLTVSAYICRMMNLADSYMDIYNLLPESTHQYLNIVIHRFINGSLPTLHLDVTTLAQESEKDAIQLINNRILTNLLLGDA